MNDNNILGVFFNWVDRKKFEDINSFLSVNRVYKITDILKNKYQKINEVISNKRIDNLKIEDMSEEEQKKIKEVLYNIRYEYEKIEELETIINGDFLDLQQYYFMQGFKANTELREQLQRLIDKN